VPSSRCIRCNSARICTRSCSSSRKRFVEQEHPRPRDSGASQCYALLLPAEFYDTIPNLNVGYAEHAISIDENRADFKRVG
jgi:hypothetical protein